ncbi:hypothetical protein TBLA_0A03930 [Henningerozyma blattae CBS 6284]|uniref:Defective in cullin neddylation protein n=1 Tax=Henningerozyma blattae (strain ATCC 34711 / CBS 6284 / DSM 70876 / NBRC 10599 / NRRL Y-10934 / UCD 77-7) TaxID=1071380 RepID=I2GVN9_HENB6|nr:hypothetical protein TBLA_0A03930 [Tetrapisispora blattae CBS 6284]CCH58191.1 hypothetical protein TBLA_0A03930 [Tetrapisispora blattae CBS 6284]
MMASDQTLKEFMSLANSDLSTAQKYLKRNKWRLEYALNDFYDNEIGSFLIQDLARDNKILGIEYVRPLTELYNHYAIDSGVLGTEGLVKLVDDLGYTVDHLVTLCLAKLVGCIHFTTPILLSNFIDSLKANKCRSLEDIKNLLNEFDNKLKTNGEYYTFIYDSCFNLLLEEGKKTIDSETAQEYWDLFFACQNYPIKVQSDQYQQWFKYLSNANIKEITKDQWAMLLRFFKKFPSLSELQRKYSEDSAWPYIFDEYYEYLEDNNKI